MIKKITIEQLRIGMFIHDLNCSWMDHPFARNRLKIEDAAALGKARGTGVKELYIDTALGLDVRPEETETAEMATAEEAVAEEMPDPASQPSAFIPNVIAKLSPAEEFERAKTIYSNANQLIQGMMKDIRLGKHVEMEQCSPMVDNIMDSMFRMPSALLPLAQMKTADEYTFQHSVSVAALAVAFGRVLNLPRNEIKELSLGGLLHDVGKAKVPGRILNKPGKLDDAEFAVMKSHAAGTAELLKNTKGVGEIAFNAAAQHHERYDGTGYPLGLKGDEISVHGQMLAIVDVYDAITSIRVYHKGMPPPEALKKMFQWCGTHFNTSLMQAFIKGIGIYPAGSLVRMESDKLGIVREVVPDKLLQPVVQVIYDCNKLCHLDPETIDLSTSTDKIKSHESFEKWGINQAKWVSAYA